LIVFLLVGIFSSNLSSAQTCPTFQKRNNGNNAEICGSETGLPSNYSKTRKFSFTSGSPSSNITRNKIWKNGVLYQDGSTLTTAGTVWFGDYVGSQQHICFYADGGNGVPPAANWKFEFFDGTNTYNCSFSVDAQGNPSSFSSGTIGSNQTICSGSTPSSLTSSSSAS
jgi:hypothetical protein